MLIVANCVFNLIFSTFFVSLGFRSPDCDFTFFLSFGYRVIIIVSFIVLCFPVLMIYLAILSKWTTLSRLMGMSPREKKKVVNMLEITSKDAKCVIRRGYDPRYYNSKSFTCPVLPDECSLGAMGAPDEVKIKEEQKAAEVKWSKMTLYFFVTYLIAWMPRIVWMILSCVDGCPFPLFEQTLKLRSLIGMVTENLIILKSVLDPLLFAWQR